MVLIRESDSSGSRLVLANGKDLRTIRDPVISLLSTSVASRHGKKPIAFCVFKERFYKYGILHPVSTNDLF